MKLTDEIKGVVKNEPVSKYTTVRIGGPAEYLYIPNNSNELEEAIVSARKYGISVTILGAGSNVLISDSGIKGLVIVSTKGKYRILDDTKNVTNVICDSGLSLQKLTVEMFEKDLIGLENFSGIPCSIGGAVYNNIHGVEAMFCDVVEWVEYLDKDNHVCKVTRDECKFGYDSSTFQKNDGIVLRTCLLFEKGDGKEARAKWDEIRKKKIEVQPQKSLGCVFKNLSDDIVRENNFPTASVGWFIENKIEMSGYRIGDAMISQTHHNFIDSRHSKESRRVWNNTGTGNTDGGVRVDCLVFLWFIEKILLGFYFHPGYLSNVFIYLSKLFLGTVVGTNCFTKVISNFFHVLLVICKMFAKFFYVFNNFLNRFFNFKCFKGLENRLEICKESVWRYDDYFLLECKVD
jgi:UDP-N-acetylmuramate dehydrogenase